LTLKGNVTSIPSIIRTLYLMLIHFLLLM